MNSTTPSAIAVEEELKPLQEVSEARYWDLQVLSPTEFVLRFRARDGQYYWLKVDCTNYPALPPAWRWFDPRSGQCDAPGATPKGSGYFHSNGVICAPWNRLAYKQQDPRGPHGDWTIGQWKSNTRTGACKTLASMALKLCYQLQTTNYAGRGGN